MNPMPGASLELRIVVGLLAALCLLVVATGVARFFGDGHTATLLLSLLFCLPMGVGLLLLQPWARMLAVALLWIWLVAVVVVTMHPMADDAPVQQSAADSFVFLVPQVAICLYFLHVLGKHKGLFRWRAGS